MQLTINEYSCLALLFRTAESRTIGLTKRGSIPQQTKAGGARKPRCVPNVADAKLIDWATRLFPVNKPGNLNNPQSTAKQHKR